MSAVFDDAYRDFLRSVIHLSVFSGFYNRARILEDIELQLIDVEDQSTIDPAWINKALDEEIAAKRRWDLANTGRGDFARLDAAFQDLAMHGVIATHNAGYTLSDGYHVCLDRREHRGIPARGYCFYHGQDVEKQIQALDAGKPGKLMIAFGLFDEQPDADEPDAERAIGRLIVARLTAAGFAPEWSDHPRVRIALPGFRWDKPFPG